MTVTPHDSYRIQPGNSRVSRARFRQIMHELAAPGALAERDPGEYFDAIEATRDPEGRCVDPLFILAKFKHESSMGKAGMATTTKSWGNTRPPSFGAAEIGREVQIINGRPNGFFSKYATWRDGCVSTCARLLDPGWKYHGRSEIREVYEHPSGDVWAPAGDFNNPAGYLRAVIDFMNAYGDRDTLSGAPSQPVHLLISAGHWDTNGDAWGGVEKERTRPMAIAIADEAERRGFRVTRQVDQFNGTYRDVANWAAGQARDNGIRLLFQVHFEGTHPSVRGAFAIPPHQPSRNDYDKDAERLGLDIVKRLKVATGMPIRGNGIMLETATNARELAFFSRSASLRANTERLLVEYGASNSNREDRAIVDTPGFYEKAARATVDAFEAFYGQQVVGQRHLRNAKRIGLPENISDNPSAWHCAVTNKWVTNPKFIDFYLKYGDDALALFGLPIEGEIGVDEGGPTTVQYFERARFEWHPNNAGTPFEVLLGRVGTDLIEAQRMRAAAARRLQPILND